MAEGAGPLGAVEAMERLAWRELLPQEFRRRKTWGRRKEALGEGGGFVEDEEEVSKAAYAAHDEDLDEAGAMDDAIEEFDYDFEGFEFD